MFGTSTTACWATRTSTKSDVLLYIGQRVHGIGFFSLFSQWEMKDIHVEEAREMYGLLIVAVWSTAVALAVWRRRNRAFGSTPPENR